MIPSKYGVLLVGLLLFQGCNFSPNVYKVYANADIKTTKRNQIKLLNEKLVRGLHSNDTTAIKKILSPGLDQNMAERLDSILLALRPFALSNDYRLVNEFDILNSTEFGNNSIQVGEFNLSFVSLNKETYVTLLDISNSVYDILITAIYGNYNGKWKLNILQFGKFKLYGNTALHYYEASRKNYEKNYLMDALFDSDIARELSNPANNYSRHLSKAEIENLRDKIISDIDHQYKFPLSFTGIKSQPSVFRVNNNIWDGGRFPLFQYLTKIDIKDTVALKIENQKLEKEIENTFSGLRNNNKYIYTVAFNVVPDGIHKTYYYTFRNSTN